MGGVARAARKRAAMGTRDAGGNAGGRMDGHLSSTIRRTAAFLHSLLMRRKDKPKRNASIEPTTTSPPARLTKVRKNFRYTPAASFEPRCRECRQDMTTITKS